jgi:c-di-GMP-binding flagellar brake protein YcgR
MEHTMAERKYERFRVKVPLYISVAGDVFRKMVRIECRDLSLGGLSFETSQEIPLEANSHVVLSKVGELPEGASIEGRVVHRSQNPTTGRYWVGVEFTGFKNITREDIEWCIGCYKVKAPEAAGQSERVPPPEG